MTRIDIHTLVLSPGMVILNLNYNDTGLTLCIYAWGWDDRVVFLKLESQLVGLITRL